MRECLSEFHMRRLMLTVARHEPESQCKVEIVILLEYLETWCFSNLQDNMKNYISWRELWSWGGSQRWFSELALPQKIAKGSIFNLLKQNEYDNMKIKLENQSRPWTKFENY